MTTTWRSQIAPKLQVLLMAYTCAIWIWPPIHFVASRAWKLNPWKFGGWAMYTQPVPDVRVNVSRDAGRATQTLTPEYLYLGVPGGAEAHVLYSKTRELWGRLASPVGLANAVLSHFPDQPAIRITVRTRGMDQDGRSHMETDVYLCQRADGSPACQRE
jgi:hypothetical protein